MNIPYKTSLLGVSQGKYIRNNKDFPIELISFSLSVILIFFVIINNGISYYTNDDTSIQNALLGRYTGQAYVFHPYINGLLGLFISLFCHISNRVNWWLIYNITLEMFSLTLTHYSLLNYARRKEKSLWLVVALLFSFELAYFYTPFTWMAYTFVSTIAGAGCVAWIISMEDVDSIKGLLIKNIPGIALFMACIIERTQCAIVVLPFVIVCVIYKIAHANGGKRQYCILLVLYVGIFIILSGIGSFMRMYINGKYFCDFYDIRVRYMDYPHVTYEEDSELYNSLGWDENFYNLVNSWYFADDRVSVGSFEEIINETNETKRHQDLAHIVNTFKGTITSNIHNGFMMVWIKYATCLVVLILINWKRMEKPLVLLNWFATLFAVIFYLYLVYQGRSIERAWFTFILPLAIIYIFSLITSMKGLSEIRLLNIVIVLAMIGFLWKPITSKFQMGIQVGEQEHIINEDMKKLSADRPEDIFLKEPGYGADLIPDRIFNGGVNYTTNVITIGGSCFHSDMMYQQLKDNNIDVLTSEIFSHDNVYLLARQNLLSEDFNPECFEMYLFNHLTEHYGAIGVVQEQYSEYCYIYKFIYNISEEEEYIVKSQSNKTALFETVKLE